MDKRLRGRGGPVHVGHERGLRALLLLALGGHVQGAATAERIPWPEPRNQHRRPGAGKGVPAAYGGTLHGRPAVQRRAEAQHGRGVQHGSPIGPGGETGHRAAVQPPAGSHQRQGGGKMKREMSGGDVWAVMLTATDGRVCRWEFWNCTLTHVRELIKGYVESCPYDCDWTIKGGGMTVRGMSRQDDFGKGFRP